MEQGYAEALDFYTREVSMRYYDWENNRLEFTEPSGKKFDLKFRGNKTIVGGFSGVGKTYLVDLISKIKGVKNNNKVVDNIFVLSEDNKYRLLNGEIKHMLVIIDRGDIVLDEKIVEFINRDFNTNRYLIFIRKPVGLEITPNHSATFVNKNNVIGLHYDCLS